MLVIQLEIRFNLLLINISKTMHVPAKPESSGVTGFDNEAYLKEQTASILERVERFHDKLYLEFGGKIMFDYHAARVLPGFDPNVKMRLLQKLRDKIDIILLTWSFYKIILSYIIRSAIPFPLCQLTANKK